MLHMHKNNSNLVDFAFRLLQSGDEDFQRKVKVLIDNELVSLLYRLHRESFSLPFATTGLSD